MATRRMNSKEMLDLCSIFSGGESQLRLIGHEVRKEYEYIDFQILNERPPRKRHRLRKLMGKWKRLY